MEPLGPNLQSIETIITMGFYLIVALYAVFTIVLYYHWNEYSLDALVSKVTFILYCGLTLPLIGALGLLTLNLVV